MGGKAQPLQLKAAGMADSFKSSSNAHKLLVLHPVPRPTLARVLQLSKCHGLGYSAAFLPRQHPNCLQLFAPLDEFAPLVPLGRVLLHAGPPVEAL